METEKKQSSWTEWTEVMENGIYDAMYKTNFKKVRVKVKFATGNITAESCCHRDDAFDLAFGIRMAYLRCLAKAWEDSKYNAIKIDKEIAFINANIKEMIDSLED